MNEPTKEQIEAAARAIGLTFIPDGIWNIEEGRKIEAAAQAALRAALEVKGEVTTNCYKELQTATDGLLPCPFCGSENTAQCDDPRGYPQVRCCTCGGAMVYGDRPCEAEAAWNTRTNESAIRADERKRVVEECADLAWRKGAELQDYANTVLTGSGSLINRAREFFELATAIRKMEGGGE